MKILVTGGAGFIGTNFLYFMRKMYPTVELVVLDKLTYAGHIENLKPLIDKKEISFIQGDICDERKVREVMQDVSIVVNFAAETHVDRSLSGHEAEKLFFNTNVLGTYNLLHAARDAGVDKFLHVSTDEVYGDLDYDDPEKFHEGRSYNPTSPYSNSKAASDFAVRGFYHTYGAPHVLITNCTNNYGPFQTPEKMLPRSIYLLLSDQKLKLYTDNQGIPGRNVRDWLYVEDHCRALAIVLANGVPGETYCVGGNQELSNYDLVKKMLEVVSEVTGKTMTIDTHVELVADRPGHDRRYAMDTNKIRTELGWTPRHSFDQGFKKTIDWYTSKEGRIWLDLLRESSKEVRPGQNLGRERK